MRAAQSLDVRLFRKGIRVARSVTDFGGRFRIDNLKPGVYSLIAKGENGFAAYGLHALPSQQRASQRMGQSSKIRLVQAVEVGDVLEISTAAVPPTFVQLRGILSQNLSRIQTRFVPESEYASLVRKIGEKRAPGWDDPNGPEEFRGLRELQRKTPRKSRTRPSTALRSHDVVLEKARRGWAIRGRLYGIDPDSGRSIQIEAGTTEVTLIQNDERVAVDSVRAEGEFDFYGVKEGIYSLVAVGDGGFGAIAFRAVLPNEKDARRDRRSPIQLVRQRAGDVEELPAIAGGGGSEGIAVAMVSDPSAIKDLMGNIGIAMANAGADEDAAAGQGSGFPLEIDVPPLVGSSLGSSYEVVGDAILPNGPMPEYGSITTDVNSGFLLSATPGGSSGFAGGRFGGGGLLGIAGVTTAIVALADDDDQQTLVTPFVP